MDWGKFGKKHLMFILNPIGQDARINILEGSVRSGKTVAMIPKWIDYIKNGPKGLLIMTGVSKDTIYDNVLSDLFDTVGSKNYKYNKQSGDLRIFGRRIKVIGAKDEGSEKYLRGKTLAGAYCDEVSLMPEKFFKQLLNRLSVKGAKLYATTNPDAPFHYLYESYLQEDCKRRKSGMVKVIHFELDDNPNLDVEYKDFIKSAYSGLWYKRMILGLWVMAEGAIYDNWSSRYLFEDNELPAAFKSMTQRYIAIDYGTTNPCVFLDIMDDGDTIWVVNEYYYDSRAEINNGKQKSDPEYGNDLADFMGSDPPRSIIIDPSAASFKVEVRNRGLGKTVDADNSVNDGIRNVSSLITRGKIRIHKNKCPNLVKEIESYVWDDKARLRGIEQPNKVNDHGPDALRYFVKTILKKWRLAA